MNKKAALALGLALDAGCGGDEPKTFAPPSVPLEITAQRDAIIDASLNCGTSLDGDEQTVTKVYNTGLVGVQPTPIYGQACGPEYTREGKPVFGANVDGNRTQNVTDDNGNVTGTTKEPVKWQVISKDYFNEGNTPCERATALDTLDLCAARGDCNATDGPTSPYLPYEVQDHAKHFQSVCERLEDGLITADGLVFEGTIVDKPLGKEYTGTVRYKDGGKAEGTFVKEGENFKPIGPATITWPNGATLKIALDWNNTTSEDAKFTPPGGAEVTYYGDEGTDGVWSRDDNDKDFTYTRARYNWKTRAFDTEEVNYNDPAGVEQHIVTDAELATYTGYGRYTKFDEASKLKGYEGHWLRGKFEGRGTLINRSGQTIQAEFTAGAPDTCCDIKFKQGDGALAPLLVLPSGDGWVVSSSPANPAGEWDKYVWDDAEKKIVIKKMVSGN